MNEKSRSALRILPLEPSDEAIDLREFRFQCSLDSRRSPLSVRYLGNMLPPDAELPSDAAVQSGRELFPVNECVHLSFSKRDKVSRASVPPESKEYSVWNNVVNKKIIKLLTANVSSPGLRMRALRKERGLNQTQLAQLLGVSQSLIAKWETEHPRAPQIPAKVLVKLSELVPEGPERQWWRDQAVRQAGFIEGEGVKTSVIAKSLSTATLTRTIPLLRNPLKLGVLGQMDVAEVLENLQLPSSWFSEGGTIRAIVVKNIPLSPLISGDHIAIIDVSRRDPDRLVGCVVATRTVEGIETRLLRKDQNVYFLLPLYHQPGQSIRTLKHDGEDSIVGQVLKWIADAPGPAEKKRKAKLN